MSTQMPPVTVREAASILGLCVGGVRQLVAEGYIAKVGERQGDFGRPAWLLSADDVWNYLLWVLGGCPDGEEDAEPEVLDVPTLTF